MTEIFTMGRFNTIDYLREYKKYSSSYYVSEGIRTTAGVMIPILVAAYFGQLPAGIALGLGAMCVGLTDTTGPIHHRVNGMVTAILLLFLTTILTGICIRFPWLLAAFIALMGFACSFIGVYGNRANNVGIAGLLMMVLSIDERYDAAQIIRNSLLVTGGGLFYLTLSLLIYRLRPYKLIQQALGDEIISTAAYLRTRAEFYRPGMKEEKIYETLLEQQVQVHNKQNLVREMMFKTRDTLRESTHTSRILMMIFLDSIDLFERVMTSQQNYGRLQELAGDGKMLPAMGNYIIELAGELENIGLALQEGTVSQPLRRLTDDLHGLEEVFSSERAALMDDRNIEAFISMRHILDGLEDLRHRISVMHRYTSFDEKLASADTQRLQYDKFVSPTNFNLKLLTNNISIDSNIFRHSVRVAISLLAGYFLSRILPFGHSYWILLTIVVILKPAYSLTKSRNFERLAGTFAGAALGALLLWLLNDDRILLTVMVAAMVIAYSTIRVKYLVSVVAMTAYILIAFHFLKPGDFTLVIRDRVLDTFAGSVIAFMATIAIPPKWEHEQILDLIRRTILANADYFAYISKPFLGEATTNQEYKLRRKDSFVQLANLSDAFQRMLNEPKKQQKKIQIIHQMVVANHMLVSHIATLSSYRLLAGMYEAPKLQPIVEASLNHLSAAAEILLQEKPAEKLPATEENFLIREELKTLFQKRLQELATGSLETTTRQTFSRMKTVFDQFEYVLKLSVELEKLSGKLVKT